MVFTHAAISLLIGVVAFSFVPSPFVIIAVVLAGILPDLDLIFEHRKTFHRPFQCLIGSVLLSAVYLFSGNLLFSVGAIAFLSMSCHSVLDLLSNGKTAHPRKERDERGVYNHLEESWINPRRLVTDGSAGDFMILAVSGLAAIYVSGLTRVKMFAAVLVAGGFIYAVFMMHFRDPLLGDYDRFSELIQKRIGFGPELEH